MGKSRALKILQPRSEKVFSCRICRYISNRNFNIARHERRIHMVPKRQPQCCDIKFETKAEYYQHCEEIHPGKRTNLMSQIKYGIGAGSIVNDSIEDINTSRCNNQEYPQTRYMLRSRLRPRSKTNFGENSSDENSDIVDDSTKNINKSSRHNTDKTSSMNLTSSSSEPPDDDDHTSEFDYTSDDEKNNNKKTEKQLSEGDSYSDDRGSSSDENSENNKSLMKIDEAPISVFEQRNDRENIILEPYVEPSETIFSSSENAATPSASDTPPFVERKSVICDGNCEVKNEPDLNIPITLTPSILPLKKRILQDLALQNRENIEKARKPVGDRLYQTPMKVEWKIERVSKKYRKSKGSRLTLRKTMIAPQTCSISNDAENVPPGISFVQNDETFKVEFRKSVESTWQQVTKDHRDYLTSTGFWSLNFFNERRRD